MSPGRQKILHIAPHLGGGVGSVLMPLLKKDLGSGGRRSHSIAALEPISEAAKASLSAIGASWIDRAAFGAVRAAAAAADLVLVHWWNHPLLMKLLYEGLPPVRLALWAHVNGYHPPQSFYAELFTLPDIVAFATAASMNAPVFNRLPAVDKEKCRVIRSCSGIPDGAEMSAVKEEPFRIGYIGTVEPAKMHRRFLQLCANAGIPTPCTVAGGPAHDELRAEAGRLGLKDRFEILGPVSDPGPIFRRLHVLAYPLNPAHYGSGEQVLVETMAFGTVPVVLANPPEAALVRHGETGLVCAGEAVFTAALKYLSGNAPEWSRMSEAGRRFVREECGIEHSLRLFDSLFKDLSVLPKTDKRLLLPMIDGVQEGSPFHLYLSSCGIEAVERDAALRLAAGEPAGALPPSFFFQTRGSPAHYLKMLGADPNLELICQRCAAAITQHQEPGR